MLILIVLFIIFNYLLFTMKKRWKRHINDGYFSHTNTNDCDFPHLSHHLWAETIVNGIHKTFFTNPFKSVQTNHYHPLWFSLSPPTATALANFWFCQWRLKSFLHVWINFWYPVLNNRWVGYPMKYNYVWLILDEWKNLRITLGLPFMSIWLTVLVIIDCNHFFC